MKNDYVLNHNYGYGEDKEPLIINKLKLRNINDLKTYIEELISHCIVADVKNNIIYFYDNQKIELLIDKY